MESDQTQLCSNCKRDILSSNFVIHAIHCQRNIILCARCSEPVHKDQLADHEENQHSTTYCGSCNHKIEKCKLELHLKQDCPNRKVRCQICDLEVAFAEISDHENYCGARTEKCSECGEFVMLKYKQLHLDSNHTFIKLSDDAMPSMAWQNGRRTFGNFLTDLQNHSGSSLNSSQRKKSPTTVSSRNGSAGATTLGATQKIVKKSSSTEAKENVNENKPVVKKTEKLRINREHDLDLDQLLAMQISERFEDDRQKSDEDFLMALELSVQMHGLKDNEAMREVLRRHGVVDDLATDGNVPATNGAQLPPRRRSRAPVHGSDGSDDELLLYSVDKEPADLSLPCEFCSKMILSSELFVHQSGCEKRMAAPLLERPSSSSFLGIIELPCEFCSEMFPTFRLNSHQLLCEKNMTLRAKGQNSIRDLKDMNNKFQMGLENGIAPTASRLQGLGTRTELLQGEATRKRGQSKKKNAPSPPSPEL